MGKSEKHLRDIGAMLMIQGEAIDYNYISQWAGETQEIWEKLLTEYRKRGLPDYQGG